MKNVVFICALWVYHGLSVWAQCWHQILGQQELGRWSAVERIFFRLRPCEQIAKARSLPFRIDARTRQNQQKTNRQLAEKPGSVVHSDPRRVLIHRFRPDFGGWCQDMPWGGGGSSRTMTGLCRNFCLLFDEIQQNIIEQENGRTCGKSVNNHATWGPQTL